MGPYLVDGKVNAANVNNIIVDRLPAMGSERAKAIIQNDKTNM